MTPIQKRRAAVREALEAGAFGDAELDSLCAEFGCTKRTLTRDARQIREAMRANRRAELHVLTQGETPPGTKEDPDVLDWRSASREDGYVWMLERLAEMATDPRAIAPARVGAIKTLSSVFDQLHSHRAERGDNEPRQVDPDTLIAELKAATKGMPRKLRREILEAIG